ncbi:MAG: type I 3-dehydroquinate dehydratase [Woeseiaceae bacterium]
MKHARDIAIADRVLGTGQGPLVCVPLVARDREAILREVANVVNLEPDLIEWRADFFDRIAATDDVLALLGEIYAASRGIPLIFTIRSAREGGEPVALDEPGVAQLCVDVCGSGMAALIDFEMSAPSDRIDEVRAAARSNGTRLILSYHNFEETPDREALRHKFSSAESLGGDVAKVAVMPRDLDDVLVLLAATLQASQETGLPLISIAMGPAGALARAIGWYFGSAVTFAAGEQASAPGQLPVDAARDILRVLRTRLPDTS